MNHLSDFKVVNYRGLDGLSLSLSQANLVTGPNGIGKTALLEGMWLFRGRYNPILLWNANVQRSGKPVFDPVAALAKTPLEIHGTEGSTAYKWKVEFERLTHTARQPMQNGAEPRGGSYEPPVAGLLRTWLNDEEAPEFPRGVMTEQGGIKLTAFPAPADRPNNMIEGVGSHFFASEEILQRFSRVVTEGNKARLNQAIQLIQPQIEDIEILTDDAGQPYLSATTSAGLRRPLSDHGGGLIRLVRLYLGFSSASGGIFLSDEMENGIHHSALSGLWASARRWMAEEEVQFVAATHSAECIKAAIEAYADEPGKLSIHTLYNDKDGGGARATTFSGDDLQSVLDMDWEVR